MKRNAENIDFEIIWRKVHGSLTPEEEVALEQWLSASEQHQRYFNKAQRFYRRGSGFGSTPINSPAAFQKVMGRISDVPPRKRNRFIPYAASIAAAVLLLLVAYLIVRPVAPEPTGQVVQSMQPITPGTDKATLLLDDGTVHNLSPRQQLKLEEGGTQISSQGTSLQYQGNEEDATETKYNTLVTPRGGQFSLTLADGTRVWLNSGTTLKYPTRFLGKERKVELTGEAYFEVAKNANMPFRVLTGEQVVEALGTAFNISSYQEDSTVYATLAEGKVNVYLEQNPDVHEILLPEQQSIFDKGTRAITQRTVDVERYTAWKDGWFYFEREALESIMQTLSRWYDVEVHFNTETAKALQFTGKIRRYKELEEVLNLLEKTDEVTFTIERRSVTVK